MNKYCVYKHTAPNGKIYIGITSQNTNRRWRNGNGYYENEHFSRAIKKFGWDSFQHEVLYDNLTQEDACKIESSLIEKYHSNDDRYGYNKSSGGEKPAIGIKHSDETKKKMPNYYFLTFSHYILCKYSNHLVFQQQVYTTRPTTYF